MTAAEAQARVREAKARPDVGESAGAESRRQLRLQTRPSGRRKLTAPLFAGKEAT